MISSLTLSADARLDLGSDQVNYGVQDRSGGLKMNEDEDEDEDEGEEEDEED